MKDEYSASKNKKSSKRRQDILTVALTFCLIGYASITVYNGVHTSSTMSELSSRAAAAEQRVKDLELELGITKGFLEDAEQALSNGAFFYGSSEWEADALPALDIPLSKDLQTYLYNKCVEVGYESYYIFMVAIIWQESNFTADIISKTNDYGLMQINKVNHAWLSDELGITDFLDPYQNIDAGVHIVASLLSKYGEPHRVLMAYNLGEGGAKNYWDRGVYSTPYSEAVSEKIEQLYSSIG